MHLSASWDIFHCFDRKLAAFFVSLSSQQEWDICIYVFAVIYEAHGSENRPRATKRIRTLNRQLEKRS